METAKLTLAGTISTNVAALIENNIANEQFTKEEAATVTKIVSASKNIIAQELGRVIPLTELYKEIGDDNIQADVMIAYDHKTAMVKAKEIVRRQLSEEADELQDKLDKMLDF
jgi:fructose-1,6-bisphosphatase